MDVGLELIAAALLAALPTINNYLQYTYQPSTAAVPALAVVPFIAIEHRLR